MKTKPSGDFHELPLIVFTSISILGAGRATGSVLSAALAGPGTKPGPAALILIAALTGGALAASVLHLTRWKGIWKSWNRIGRTRVGVETALALLVAASAVTAAFLAASGKEGPAQLAHVFCSVVSAAFLVSIGWVYSLPGQLFWEGAAFLSPLLLGTAFGISMELAPGADSSLAEAFVILSGLDAVLFTWRARKIRAAAEWGSPAHPDLFRFRSWVIPARLALVPVLPVASMGTGLSVLFLACGIAFDRFAFYALGLSHTPEAEIARIEKLID